MEKTAVKIHRLYVNVYPQQLCAARLDTGRAFQQLLRLPRQINPQIADAFLGAAGVVYLTRVCADRLTDGLFSAIGPGVTRSLICFPSISDVLLHSMPQMQKGDFV